MSIPKGPLGINPIQFSIGLFSLLLLFVLYLLLPRAVRKQYFGAYPRRHAWSARSRMRRGRGYGQVRCGVMEEDGLSSLLDFRQLFWEEQETHQFNLFAFVALLSLLMEVQ